MWGGGNNKQCGLRLVLDKIRRDLEGSSSAALDLIQRNIRHQLGQHQSTVLDVKHAQIGDDAVNTANTGQGQRAVVQNLVLATLGNVLHGHNNTSAGAGNKIHSTAHTLDHLAGNDPVGKITFGRDLKGTENGQVNVRAADHGKRVVAREQGSAGQQSNGLLAGIDQIGVLLTGLGEGTKAQDTVLALQVDGDTLLEVVGGKHGHTNAQVDIHAVLELLGSTANNLLAATDSLVLLGGGGANDADGLVLGQGQTLDSLLVVLALDDALDKDAGQVDILRAQ